MPFNGRFHKLANIKLIKAVCNFSFFSENIGNIPDFKLVYARCMYKAAMNRIKQISWTLDPNITFYLIVEDIKLFFLTNIFI